MWDKLFSRVEMMKMKATIGHCKSSSIQLYLVSILRICFQRICLILYLKLYLTQSWKKMNLTLILIKVIRVKCYFFLFNRCIFAKFCKFYLFSYLLNFKILKKGKVGTYKFDLKCNFNTFVITDTAQKLFS